MFHPPLFLQWRMWCKSLMYWSSIAMYLKPKWLLQIYRMQHVLTMTEHTLTLGYFHVSLFLQRDSLSLSFMSLNNTDVNFSCFKSFYENVSLDSLFIIIRKTFWSIEVLLTNYPTTWCCFYYYKIDMLHFQECRTRDMYWFFPGLSCVLAAAVSCTMGG